MKKENSPNPEPVNVPPITSLAPKILTDEKDIARINPYLNAIKAAIDTKGINNIALTGNYGSGKSTIIRTFQSRNSAHKFLNISLASFVENKNDKEPLEPKLEISILQQIFYRVKQSEIPDSRFKRIVNITTEKLWITAITMILWTLSTLLLFKFNYINKLNPETWDVDQNLDGFAILTSLIFFIGIGFFGNTIVRLFSNSKINKFNIKGELELGENADKSIFNQHLEEILYFFERTQYSVVILEDIDRFDSTDIFTKLREINILLNNSDSIKREIKFIYAIKDELFEDKGARVKFFDFIIPVISFINPSNAAEQLTKLIKNSNLDGQLSKDFTEDVITFIDDIDMRLLINIVHEYSLYRENLSSELKQDELFAIIVYKNMYPKDFGLLSQRKGELYQFLSNKNLYISARITTIEAQISTIQNAIDSLEHELLSNLEELRAVYINALQRKSTSSVGVIMESLVRFSELSEEDNFEKLRQLSKINFQRLTIDNSGRSQISNEATHFTFAHIEGEVNPNVSYLNREQLIIRRNDHKGQSLKSEMESLRVQKRETEFLSLKEIFREIDITSFLGPFTNNLLVRNLLLNGYINENYTDLISLFHEVNITKDDHKFEQKIKSGFSLSFDYKLTNTENLIKKINGKYFRWEGILNNDLFDVLIENPEKHPAKFNEVMLVLSSAKEVPINFIEAYIDRGKNIDVFINKLCHSWRGFWNHVEQANYTDERIRQYLILMIKNADIADIESIHYNSNLASQINASSDLLTIAKDQLDRGKLRQVISSLGIRFDVLRSAGTSDNALLEFIYKRNHYAINKENIAFILELYGKKSDLGIVKNPNYSEILHSECTNLQQYIEDNLKEYIHEVLLKAFVQIDEEQTTIHSLLTSDKLDDNTKIAIIDKQIASIDELPEETSIDLQRHALQKNKVVPAWKNIFTYYRQLEPKGFDEAIIQFLNFKKNYIALGQTRLDESSQDDSFTQEISSLIISTANLSFDSFKHLINSIPYSYDEINTVITGKKALVMIDEKSMNLTPANISYLAEHHPDLVVNLLEINQVELTEKFKDLPISEPVLVKILDSKNFANDVKLAIIRELIPTTNSLDADVIESIASIAETSQIREATYDFLDKLLDNTRGLERRLSILNQNHQVLTNDQLQRLVESLNDDYIPLFEKQHKPTFKNTSLHRTLFDELLKRGMISKYKASDDEKELRVHALYIDPS